MNSQVKAIQLSLIVHALALMIAISAGNLVFPERKTLVIDFSVENSGSAGPSPKYEHRIMGKGRRQPGHSTTSVVPPAPADKPVSPKSDAVAQAPAVTAPPAARQMSAPTPSERAAAGAGAVRAIESSVRDTAKAEGNGQSGGDTGGLRESIRKRYLNEHFAYIRDTVLKNLSYPSIARRMGWSGKVMLSFFILHDGSVNGIKVIQSSGVELLDKSAVEAVRKAAPFPRPPAEAEVVIPVVYRLN